MTSNPVPVKLLSPNSQDYAFIIFYVISNGDSPISTCIAEIVVVLIASVISCLNKIYLIIPTDADPYIIHP